MAKVKYKGKVYNTKRDLAEALGVNYDTLNMRMSRGLSLAHAVDFKPKSTIRYKKKEYRSYQDLIDTLKLGLTVNQLQYRLKKCGGSLDKAVSYQVAQTEVTYKGKTYSSLKKLCDQLGLVYSTVKNRINFQGKSVTEAIRMSEVKKYVYKGKVYTSRLSLAKEFGVKYSTLTMRMSRGWSLEKAVEYKPKRKTVYYKGEEYSSLKNLCDCLGVKYTSLRNRLYLYHQSLEYAVESLVRKKGLPKVVSL